MDGSKRRGSLLEPEGEQKGWLTAFCRARYCGTAVHNTEGKAHGHQDRTSLLGPPVLSK